MSITRAGEVWKEIKPFAIQDLAKANSKSSGGDTNDYSILLYKAGNKKISKYSATESGLSAALAGAVSGDVVYMPAGTIGGNQSVPSGVSLVGLDRRRCILTGQIILGASSCLGMVSVTRSGDSASAIYGVVAEGALSKVYDCLITVTNTGGDAVGVYGSGGSCKVDGCDVYADGSGVGYAYYANNAEINARGGSAHGSTAPEGSE